MESLTEADVNHIAEKAADVTMDKLNERGWIDRETHFLDHVWTCERRADEENERARRTYVDSLIDRERNAISGRDKLRQQLKGGSILFVVISSMTWVANNIEDFIKYITQIGSGGGS